MKKILSVLVLTLIVVLINPCIVHAADNMDNLSYTFTDANGNSHSTEVSGKAKVLIFGREVCGNTAYTLQKLKDKQREHSKFDILLIDVDSSDSGSLKSYADNYVVSGLSFVTSDDASNAMWNYVHKFPDISDGGSVGLPVVVYIDSNNKIAECTSGPCDIDSKAGELFGYESEEDRPVEFSINVKYNQTEARSMFDSINDFRQSSDEAWYWNIDDSKKIYCSGLKSLQYDYALEKIAMQRAAELVIKYDHQRPNGTYVWTLLSDYSSCGENIAYGQRSAEEVFVDWREDDKSYAGQGHRRNMLDSSYNRVGIACTEYLGIKFWVQVFEAQSGELISETSANNNSTKAVIEVLNGSIKERGFFYDKDTYSIVEGQCKQIQLPTPYIGLNDSLFTTYPIAGRCTYTVADSTKATINDNEICGLAEGTTTLTAKANVAGADIEKNIYIDVYQYNNPVEGKSPTYFENPEYSFISTDGRTITTIASGRPKILIFCTEWCHNCEMLLKDIEAYPGRYEGIDIVSIDLDAKESDSVADYASAYGNAPVTFCYGGKLFEELDYTVSDAAVNEYKNICGNSDEYIGTPFIVFINKDNLIVYNMEGYVDNFQNYVKTCFSEEWDNEAAIGEAARKAEEQRKREEELKKQEEEHKKQEEDNDDYYTYEEWYDTTAYYEALRKAQEQKQQEQLQQLLQQAKEQQELLQKQLQQHMQNSTQINSAKKIVTVETDDSSEDMSANKKSNKPSVGTVSKLSVSANNNKTTLKWKKVKKASGYQIQISTNKKFKKANQLCSLFLRNMN